MAQSKGTVQVVTTVVEWRRVRSSFAAEAGTGGNGRIGLVPTMGCLHQGHLNLIELCSKHCQHVVVSIFVNPAQFAPHEDFDAYPRQLAQDVSALERLGVRLTVLAPTVPEMYETSAGPFPPHPTIPITMIPPAYVDVERFVAGKAEALSRKGFFSGVATVCTKLFNVVRPDVVVFGKKDRLQCYVIQQIVKDLSLPIEVVLGETMREANGLAMSSRNKYLSPIEFDQAKSLYQAMLKGQQLVRGSGSGSGSGSGVTVERVVEVITGHIQATISNAQVVYVVISDLRDMKDYDPTHLLLASSSSSAGSTPPPPVGIVSLAVKVGTTRLIDNLEL